MAPQTANELLFRAEIKVESHYSKKNSKVISFNRKTRNHFVRSSNKAQRCESALIISLAEAIEPSKNTQFPLTCPLHLKCLFMYKVNKNGSKTKKIIDLSNLIQGPEDALQKAGIIQNDNLIESYDGTRRVTDADETKLIIELYRF